VNARDAMPTGGKLSISLGLEVADQLDEQEASAEPTSVEAVIRVTDTGCGMSDETMGRMFEPFFTTKPRGQSTGLGLSVVHGIVADHGGRIVVDSQPGRGTEVVIRFPAFETTEQLSASSVVPEAPSGRGELVLLVYPDEYPRDIIADSLESAGYGVVAVADDRSAIEVVQTRRADLRLVVLDMELPDGGSQLCLDEIRKASSGLHVVALADRSEDSSPSVRGDRERVLYRPFQVSELLEMVAAALNSPVD